MEPSKYSPKSLWDPFRSLSDIRDDFDRLFGRIIPERMGRKRKTFIESNALMVLSVALFSWRTR